MKHYMDINNLREQNDCVGEVTIPKNTECFEVGDIIQITEKYDGSNASIQNCNGEIHCFSRKQELNSSNTLNGFYNYISNKVQDGLVIDEGIVIFGEWSGARNKLVYDIKNEWFVFDIFDTVANRYWEQSDVKAYCTEKGLQYIHELYNGPFVSWEHCRTFLNSPFYGKKQEGIVIKNQSKLTNANGYFYLKIVNNDFKERNIPKLKDPLKDIEKEKARTLMESIVTQNRIEKMLFKLRDENVLGDTITPEDMQTIAKHLPARIYEDCLKEEPETIKAAGEYAGKLCSAIVMSTIRNMVFNSNKE